MCRGNWSVHYVSPLSPVSPSSLGRKRSPELDFSSIPQIVFIPLEINFDESVSHSHRSYGTDGEHEYQDIMGVSSSTPMTKDTDACSSSIPRLPRRQASMECDPEILKDNAKSESSPRLPRRSMSVSSFEEWLEEGSLANAPSVSELPLETTPPPSERKLVVFKVQEKEEEEEEEVVLKSPSCRRHSCPVIRDLPDDHFQYIRDPEAGGKCPRLPQRRRSIRKLPEAPECIQSSPRLRTTSSGHF